MKRHILGLARATGLLRQADRLMLLRGMLASRAGNRAFALANPGFATPPADLAFDAYHHVDHTAYRDVGRRHAEAYARVIADELADSRLAILEWGCGPGRIIRHLRDCLPDRELDLTGADCNARSIAWCAQNIPGITFLVNDFLPPLALPDAAFDVAYSFSVFTHLSEPAQKAWSREMLRVLKPGGLLVSSTHGDYYRDRLAQSRDAARYADGQMVVQEGYEEGKKWYLALHPPRYVREELLAGFTDIRQAAVPPEAGLHQDLWVARKPA